MCNVRASKKRMSRPRSGFYNAIEYIGPRPQKPQRPNFFGGWVILVIAVGIGCWFGLPLVHFLKAAQTEASSEQAETLISALEDSKEFGPKLAAAALAHSRETITYDAAYYKIPYPNGDVAANKGGPADVIIRCYRKLGIDLQKEIHEDMTDRFKRYPDLWEAKGPDSSIDHRRVANLKFFLESKGQVLTTSREPFDYRPGDIVIWSLANAESHIGIVVPGPGSRNAEPWVVHNMGSGVKWEGVLFDFKIEGHYRYPAP
ncbi:MAG: DUF1287 domain-containing protein [Gloeobacteraceae cyanobacterium ES-bin-144]|nr:DUF1287 domain-containing protein [Verrucomicrobiales bacterium]